MFFIIISNINVFCSAESTQNDCLFIHHSCGRNWLQDGLHDALLAKDYIDERNDIYYNTDLPPDPGRPDSLSPTPGDKTNMYHWLFWFNDYLDTIRYYESNTGFNHIIMFKSCYPTSDITSDGNEPGNPFSETKTLANYKAVYRSYNGSDYTYNGYTYQPLEDIFSAHPDILFIPITAPPLHNTATTDENAHRARLFNNWLTNQWLPSYNTQHPDLNNVAVYDWFDFLANPDTHPTFPNRLKEIYGGSTGDSHPNTLGNQESTQNFASAQSNFIDEIWTLFVDLPNLDWEITIEPSRYHIPNNEIIELWVNATEINESDSIMKWEINILNYSTDNLKFNNITEGSWLSTQGPTMFSEGIINQLGGHITNISCEANNAYSLSDGTLCQVYFTAVKTGLITIKVQGELFTDQSTQKFTIESDPIQIIDDQTQNQPPILLNSNPENSTIEQLSYRKSQIWSINIADPDGDVMTGVLRSNEQESSINGINGTYGIYLTNLSSGTYMVEVEVTDGKDITSGWYQFSIAKDSTDGGSNTPGFTIVSIILSLVIFIIIFNRKKS